MSDADALQLRLPASVLADHVECYWAGRSEGHEGARELVLANASMSLVFSVGDSGTPAKVLTGPHSRPIPLDASRGFSAVGVKFKVGGAFPFVETPSRELHNQTVRLDELWDAEAADIEEQIWQARTVDEKFSIIERALLQRLDSAPSRHPGVVYALRAIDRARGNCRVATLAADVGITERRLGQLFAREIGFSPKLLGRMRRFQEALRLIDSSARVDWTEIALSAGYYDQPHFNHEFRAFCGMEPSAYLRKRLSQSHVQLEMAHIPSERRRIERQRK